MACVRVTESICLCVHVSFLVHRAPRPARSLLLSCDLRKQKERSQWFCQLPVQMNHPHLYGQSQRFSHRARAADSSFLCDPIWSTTSPQFASRSRRLCSTRTWSRASLGCTTVLFEISKTSPNHHLTEFVLQNCTHVGCASRLLDAACNGHSALGGGSWRIVLAAHGECLFADVGYAGPASPL